MGSDHPVSAAQEGKRRRAVETDPRAARPSCAGSDQALRGFFVVPFRREMEERLAAFVLRVAAEKTALLCFDGNLLRGTARAQ